MIRTTVTLGVVALLVAIGLVWVLAVSGAPSDGEVPEAAPAAVPALAEPLSDPTGGAVSADEYCARRVVRSGWEPRPDNAAANGTVPPEPVRSGSWGGVRADTLRDKVTGDFVGTTDEIIQWASCKWGFPADVTRAQALRETGWRQTDVGDGGESFGILQIRSTAWPGTAPWSAQSTAYNLDWSLALRRACVEGLVYDGVGRGDLWGCIGVHYSGVWDDAAARNYAAAVRQTLEERSWEAWPSAGSGEPPPRDPVGVPG